MFEHILTDCKVFFSCNDHSLYAASLSGSKLGMEELDVSPSEDSGVIATHLNQIKRWLLSHSQHLNFLTILVLASVSLSLHLLPHFFI